MRGLITWGFLFPASLVEMMELQTRTCQPPDLCHCRTNDKWLKTAGYSGSSPQLWAVCACCSLGVIYTNLQMSLFSLPLSVLPDWLVVLELFSALMSCGWCSGNSSSAFLRQMAANSILATGMAADWPSLSTQSDKRTSQRRQLDRRLKPLMNKSGFSRHSILDISDCVASKLLIKMYKRKNMHLLIYSLENYCMKLVVGTDLYILFWLDWDARMTLRWYPWPTIDWTIPFLQGRPLLSCSDPWKLKTDKKYTIITLNKTFLFEHLF